MFTTQCVVVWLSPARYAINRSDFKACFARRGSGLVQNVGGIERHGYGNLWKSMEHGPFSDDKNADLPIKNREFP